MTSPPSTPSGETFAQSVRDEDSYLGDRYFMDDGERDEFYNSFVCDLYRCTCYVNNVVSLPACIRFRIMTSNECSHFSLCASK